MNIGSQLKKIICSSLMAFAFVLPNANATIIDVELSLTIDVSGSVSTSEYNLQMDGYAAAFRNATVQNNIANSVNGIAVNAVFFSSNFFSTSLDTFVVLNTIADANAFADVLDAFVRPGGGGTSIYTGVNRAVDLMINNGFTATRSLIDVSGDGTSSASLDQAARDNAVSNGITINGLAIGSSSISNYYTNNVIGGPGAFVNVANTFGDFETAVINKLQRETSTSVSEPATLGIMALSFLVLARLRKKA
ncbi:DUF1194 domain-containing protein [Colwellia sp. RE-S-Sl-9]